MKSKKDNLKKRGYLDQELIIKYQNIPNEECLKLLLNNDPQIRTAAAVILGNRKVKLAIKPLCFALENEKKLYTKIAISEALSNIGTAFPESSVPELVKLLGKIGNNQHKALPKKPFIKKSYPLPRDITARTIIRMGNKALPFLEKVLLNGEIYQITEAIDAIGFISFYSKDSSSLNTLKKCLSKYDSNDIIKWKIIRAYQAFPNEEVISFLEQFITSTMKKEFIWEAKRSLKQIKHLKF